MFCAYKITSGLHLAVQAHACFKHACCQKCEEDEFHFTIQTSASAADQKFHTPDCKVLNENEMI